MQRDLPDILHGVRDELAAVEDQLAAAARIPDAPILAAALAAILSGPAKRLRPAIALLTAQLFNLHGELPVKLAAATEVLHGATLVHDDIVDEAGARRGRPSVHVTWSTTIAVLAGDFLFATSADLVAQLDRPQIVRLFAQTIHRMARSEFDAPDPSADSDTIRRQYLAKIGNKTASLIALACDAAADLGDADAPDKAALHEYGWNLGMAFQIADDVLDVVGEPEETGKPVGGDLAQGVLTLPVILYLRHAGADGRSVDSVVQGDAPPAAVTEAVARVRASSAPGEAMRVAAEYAERARVALDGLAAGSARTALDDLIGYAVARSR